MTIFVAGHRGLVGSAIVRNLIQMGLNRNDLILKTHSELDLTNQTAVDNFFNEHKIDQIYLAAAKVGGIHANNLYPADFLYHNLMIETNVLSNANKHNINKVLFLGSTCIYPKFATNPITEDQLLTGKLEHTNESYAIAKIAGLKLCEAFNRQYNRQYRSVMPSNLYGIYDSFHPENSHVIPGMMQRFHAAKVKKENAVTVWGDGTPRREFTYCDDLALACIIVQNVSDKNFRNITTPYDSAINIGPGYDITISELVENMKTVTGFTGDIIYDKSKPNGTLNKLTDNSKIISLGWKPQVSILSGLQKTYSWYCENLVK